MACAPSHRSTEDSGNDDDNEIFTESETKSKSRSKRLTQGGYECAFIDELPKHLQTECSICLCVLREPCLVDCCGNRFCRTCIDAVKAESKPCPLCNTQFTAVVLDKQLKRTLNELRVYCSNKKSGCEWTGELGGVPEHLNVDCEDGVRVRLNGCSFAQLQCAHCEELIPRHDITKHESDQCLQRPYSCDYCNEYSSTCLDVTENHWPVCPSRSAPCPDGCGKYLIRKELENHQINYCPLTVIDCAFDYVGCEVRLARQDMESHIAENLAGHMTLQALHHQQQLKQLHKAIDELKLENKTMKKQLEDQNKQLVEQQLAFKKLSTTGAISDSSSKAQTPQTSSPVANVYPGALIVFKNINEHTIWWSPPFYTHSQGYKVCLKVFPNGYHTGENVCISVYINIMKGEYDDQLQWPFRGSFRVRLLKNSSDGYAEQTIRFHDRIHPRVSGRVVRGDKCIQGFGVDKFMPQSALFPDYVKDNSLTFCILSSDPAYTQESY